MNFLIKSAQNIREVSGRSFSAKIFLFLLMAYVFLWVPDLDLALIGILHHRSIITHSILPAFLLMVLGARAGAAPVAGALLGLAVHLSCDLLSPMVGYGQIWLPAPVKAPLGPLSYFWLFGNAFVAFVLARIIIVKAFNPIFGYLLILMVGGLTSVSYGWANEGSIPAIIVTLGVFSLSLIGSFRKFKRDPRVRKVQGNIAKSAAKASDAVSDACEGISGRLDDWREDSGIKKPFLSQKRAVENALLSAESNLCLQRTLEADPKFAASYADVRTNFEDDEGLKQEESGSLKIDLLIGIPDESNSKHHEKLILLQKEHRDFLLSIQAKVLPDVELLLQFSSVMREWGGEALVEQILNLNKI